MQIMVLSRFSHTIVLPVSSSVSLLRKLAIVGEAPRACERRARGAPLLRKFGNLSIRETRTLTCKHKILGENWLYLRPYLKAFSVFNVLETCRVYLLAIDLGIVKFIKKFIERFFEKCEVCKRGLNYVQKL